MFYKNSSTIIQVQFKYTILFFEYKNNRLSLFSNSTKLNILHYIYIYIYTVNIKQYYFNDRYTTEAAIIYIYIYIYIYI